MTALTSHRPMGSGSEAATPANNMATYTALADREPTSQPLRDTNDASVDETPTTSNKRDDPGKKRPGRLRDSLGCIVIVILIAGAVFTVIAVAFLTVLWRGAVLAANDLDPGAIWQRIVLADWAVRTVTILSALIRLAISLQIGCSMSMVGSLVLERYSVELPAAAFFALVRAFNAQPMLLLFSNGRALSSSSKFCLCVVVVAGAILGISAFTSTILLSDFGRIHTAGDVNITAFRDGLPLTGSGIDLWRSASADYPRFAEYTSDKGELLAGPHIDDTGTSLRAMLPFSTSAERSTLRNFTGVASVFDTRFTCFSPNLTLSSFNMTVDSMGGGLITYRMAVAGRVTFEGDRDNVFQAYGSKTWPSTSFLCPLSTDEEAPYYAGNISVCALPSRGVQNPPPVGEPVSSGEPQATMPLVFLIFKVTGLGIPQSLQDFVEYRNFSAAIFSAQSTTTSEGPWSITTFGSDGPVEGFSMSGTACITAGSGRSYRVRATSRNDGLEPTLEWAVTTKQNIGFGAKNQNRPYNSEKVRRQLNALPTKPSSSERGIMDLDGNFSDFTGFNFPSTELVDVVDASNFLPRLGVVTNGSSGGLDILTNKTSDAVASMVFGQGTNARNQAHSIGHPSHVSLFSDILESTASPAKAMQAWYTTLQQRQFYDSLPRLNNQLYATCVFSVEASAPIRWTGYIIIMVTLAVHWILVASITVCFLRQTQYTMLGNIWQAVAQVSSEATAPLLLQATNLKDCEVKKLIRRNVESRQKYRIVRSWTTGRRELGPAN